MSLDNLRWLIGQWEGIQGNGIYHEEWSDESDDRFNGRAYSIKKGEISDSEKLTLHYDNDDIYYTAEVAHNPGPVSFKMTSSGIDTFVFENPNHDFPKKITYYRKDENNLVATIEADNGGKVKKFEFNLRRV